MSLLMSESVIVLVESLYAEVTEAVKSRAALSASFSKLIWTLGEIIQRISFETAPNLWICQLGPKDS
jgi:hypothetical protein